MTSISRFFGRLVYSLTIASMVLWSLGSSVIPVYAAAPQIMVFDQTQGNLRLKQTSAFQAVAGMAVSSVDSGVTLTSLTVSFNGMNGTTPTWTASGAASSELLDLATTNGGVSLWKESGGATGFQSSGGTVDTQVTLAASPTYAAGNAFTMTPATAPALAANDMYYVVLKSDTSGVTNNNAFNVAFATNAVVTSGTVPTLGAAFQTPPITMDTVGPSITSVQGSTSSTSVKVFFSEQVQKSAAVIAAGDFTYVDGGGAATQTISSVSHTAGQNQATLTMSAALDAEDVDATPATLAPAVAILDMAGNAASTTASSFTNPVQVTSATIPLGTANAAYTTTLASSGGSGAVGWQPENGNDASTLSTLGLSLATSSGTLAGTIPTGTAGKFKINVRATDVLTSAVSFTTGATGANPWTGVTGSYTTPVNGDVVLFQTGAGAAVWGVVTDATSTNQDTFKINNATLAASTAYRISKIRNISAADTSVIAANNTYTQGINLAVGDLVLYPKNANGTNYDWGVVTTAATIAGAAGPGALQITGAAAPTYSVAGRITKIVPELTTQITVGSDGVWSANTGNYSPKIGDVIFVKNTEDPAQDGWRVVTNATMNQANFKGNNATISAVSQSVRISKLGSVGSTGLTASNVYTHGLNLIAGDMVFFPSDATATTANYKWGLVTTTANIAAAAANGGALAVSGSNIPTYSVAGALTKLSTAGNSAILNTTNTKSLFLNVGNVDAQFAPQFIPKSAATTVTVTGTGTALSASSTVQMFPLGSDVAVSTTGTASATNIAISSIASTSGTNLSFSAQVGANVPDGAYDVKLTTGTNVVFVKNAITVGVSGGAGGPLALFTPANGTTDVSPTPRLSFATSSNATVNSYRITVRATQDQNGTALWDYVFPKTDTTLCTASQCSIDFGHGAYLQITQPSRLNTNTTYYWQVRSYSQASTVTPATITAASPLDSSSTSSFTTTGSVSDFTPPKIDHRPIYEARKNTNLAVFAKIFDNIATSATTPALSAKIFYCSGSACTPTTEGAAPTALGSGYFQFAIPSAVNVDTTGTIIRYYLQASDGTNTATVVEQPSGTIRNAANPFQFTSTAVPGSTATIAGTVKDSTDTCSTAVRQATVFAEGTGFTTTSSNDVNCTYTISGLTTGSPYNIVAVKDGFSDRKMDGVNSGATGRAFKLGQGAAGGFGGDTSRPRVKLNMPGDKMQNLPGADSNMKVMVIFDKAMSQSSVTSNSNMTVNELDVQTGGLTNITATKGAWTYNSTFTMPFKQPDGSSVVESNVAVWALSSGQTLGNNKTIAVILTPSVVDTAGNAIQSNTPDGSYAFSFSTGGTFAGGSASGSGASQIFTFATGEKFGEGAAIGPHVVGTTPPPGSSSVPTNTKMSISFDRAMADDASGYTLLSNLKLYAKACSSVTASDTALDALNAATLTSDKMSASVTLKSSFNSSLFVASTQYCLRVLGGAKGAGGLTIAPPGQETNVMFFSDFKTSTGTDTAAPTVTGSVPDNAATSVPLPLGAISVSFSKDMDPSTITTSTFTVTTGSSSVSGTVEYRPRERTVFFYPSQSLTPTTSYTLSLTAGVTAMNGVALAATTRTFTTGTADTTAPVIGSMTADDTNLAITFSKPMNAAQATDSSNFATSVLKSGNYTIKYGTAGTDVASAGTAITLPTSASFTWDARSNTMQIQGYRPSATTPATLRTKQLYVSVGSTVTDLGGVAISTTGSANTVLATVQDSNATKGALGPMDITSDLTKQVGEFRPDNFSSGTFGFVPQIQAQPFNTMAGVTTIYGIRLPISKQIPNGGTIVLTFPTGFDVSSAKQDFNSPKRRDLNKGNSGTITFKCQTNTTSPNGKSCGGGAVNSDENSSTGTGTIASTGTAVTGVATAFVTELVVGGTITAGGQTRTIATITSATALTTDTAFSPVIAGGSSFTYTNDDGVVINAVGRTVTVYVSGATQSEGHDFLDLDIAGIKNSTIPKDSSTSGYSIDIKTKNGTTTLESFSSLPFFIQTAGSTTVSGTVTLSTASSGTMTVFLDSQTGGSLSATTSDFLGGTTATYTFSNLLNGDYGLRTDSYVTIGANSFVGKFPPERITVTGNAGNSFTVTKNFTLTNATSGGTSVTVAVDGPSAENIDIFASSPTAGFRVIQKTLDSSGGSENFTIVLPNGQWNIGVGPQMPKGITSGPPPAPTYLMPRPVDVLINGASCTIVGVSTCTTTFTLTNSTKTIKGIVKDTSGGLMADVDVNAFDTKSGIGTFARTDTTGTFTLNVTTGLYNVGVFVPGMPPTGDTTVEVTSHATTYLKIKGAAAITPAAAATSFVIKMSKADYTISGTVTDGTNVIQGASVNAFRQGAPGVFAQTDSKGQYTLYVSAGTWTVRAFLPAYGNLTAQTATITDANATDVNFTPTATGTFYTVIGTVTVGGSAQSGAQVRIRNSSFFNQTFTATDGTYTFNVPAGSDYIVDGFVPGVGELAPLTAFAVSANVTGKDLTVAALRTITLTFSSTITRAFVQLLSTTTKARIGKEVKNALSDTLTVPDGSYLVSVDLQGAQIAKTAIAATGSTCDTTTGTTLYCNTTGVMTVNGNEALTVTIPTLRTITFNVVDSLSAALSDAWVELNNPTTGEHFGDKTNSSGQVTLKAADGTAYFVNAMKPGYLRKATALTVSSSSITETLSMTTASTSIAGQVKVGSAGVQNAFVHADKQGGGFAATQTDASGNYTLPVTEGFWTLAARADGYAEVTLSELLHVTSAAATGKDITLSATVTSIAPTSQSITPANGGTLQDDTNGIKLVVPGNALGSSSSSGNIQAKKTSNILTTDTGRPLAGLEITATDSSGTEITQLSDNVTIELAYTKAELAAQKSATDTSIDSKTEVDLMVIGFWDESIQNWSTLTTSITYLDSAGAVITSPAEDLSTTGGATAVASVKLTALTNHFSLFAPIVSTDPSAPSTPTGFSTGTSTASAINMSWSVVSGATGYDIYRSTTFDGTFSLLGSEPTVPLGSTVTYQDTTGLTASTTYFYKITALNNNGESASARNNSDSTSGTTLLASSSSSSSSSGGGGGGGSSSSSATSTTTTATAAATAAAKAKADADAVAATDAAAAKKAADDKAAAAKTATVTNLGSGTFEIKVNSSETGGVNVANGEITLPPADSKFSSTLTKKQAAKVQVAIVENVVDKLVDTAGGKRIAPLPIFNRTLTLNLRGEDVRTLQLILQSKGYYKGKVSGTMDKSTVDANKKFQKTEGIATEKTVGFGNVGPKTQSVLNPIVKQVNDQLSARLDNSAAEKKAKKAKVDSDALEVAKKKVIDEAARVEVAKKAAEELKQEQLKKDQEKAAAVKAAEELKKANAVKEAAEVARRAEESRLQAEALKNSTPAAVAARELLDNLTATEIESLPLFKTDLRTNAVKIEVTGMRNILYALGYINDRSVGSGYNSIKVGYEKFLKDYGFKSAFDNKTKAFFNAAVVEAKNKLKEEQKKEKAAEPSMLEQPTSSGGTALDLLKKLQK